MMEGSTSSNKLLSLVLGRSFAQYVQQHSNLPIYVATKTGLQTTHGQARPATIGLRDADVNNRSAPRNAEYLFTDSLKTPLVSAAA